MCLESPDSCSLVSIADADQLVRVAAPSSRLPDYLTKLAELLAYLTKRANIQVQKRDASEGEVLEHNLLFCFWQSYLYSPYISQSMSLGVAGDRKR